METSFYGLLNEQNSHRKWIEAEFRSEAVKNILKFLKTPSMNSHYRISELDLSNCRMVNIILEIKDLPLRKLSLQKNEITYVPRCLYLGLEDLEFLDLSQNNICNFDIEPNCCKTLKVLILSSNKLKDIPQWVMNHCAVQLRDLIYDCNKITNLRCIFGITMNFWITKLSLRNCIVRKEDWNFLKNCRYLEELDLSNIFGYIKNINIINSVETLLYQPNWRNLCVLRLNYLSLSLFPEGLFWLERLIELHLMGNYLMWLPKDGFEFFVNLEVLNLSHNSIVFLPEKLNWLVYMKVLNLSYNRLEVSYNFSKMESLEFLDLYSNRIETFDHNLIGANVRSLDVEHNFFDTEKIDIPFYDNMKRNLRMKILEERTDGFEDTSELKEHFTSEDESNCSLEVMEDWDEEIKLNEQITVSDNEWKDEAPILPYIPRPNVKKPDIYNDDIIFCDAD